MKQISEILRPAVLFMIRVYASALRPLLIPYACCRFYPTCSAYAHEAVLRHGVWRGVWMSIWRIGRCNPLNRGGVDLP